MLFPGLLFFSFSFMNRSEAFIPEPIISIPISVVLIGSHQFSRQNRTLINTQWFSQLSHIMTQAIETATDFYVSSDPIKIPPLRYRLTFAFKPIKLADHSAFEAALSLISRRTPRRKHRVIHPYPLSLVLQSIVDHYDIPGYVFFVFGSDVVHYSYCEGVFENESTSSVAVPRVAPFKPLNKSKSWGSQVDFSGLGNWTTSDSVFSNLQTIPELRSEANAMSSTAQCGGRWWFDDRTVWIDASRIISGSLKGKNQTEKMANLEELFLDKCPNAKMQLTFPCLMLKKSLLASKKSNHSDFLIEDESTVQKRFLANASSIILDAVKTFIVPDAPSFETALPDHFRFSISVLNDYAANPVRLDKLKGFLQGYLVGSATASFVTGTMKLISTPFLSLSLANLQPEGKHKLLKPAVLREGFQAIPISHKLSGLWANRSRDIVLKIAVFDDTAPILLNRFSPSFAFDTIAFAVTGSAAFDPLPILRATLVHMYGLPPARYWHSMSVLSVSSAHPELSVISRDAAFRNALRFELMKTNTKIKKRLGHVIDIIDAASGNHTFPLSETVLRNQIAQVNEVLGAVVGAAGALKFDWLLALVRKLGSTRKAFSKQLKQVIKELEEEFCQYAPARLIAKTPKLIDRLDSYAVAWAIVWIAVLCISSFSLMVVLARGYKRD
jgi:hypothetical protein